MDEERAEYLVERYADRVHLAGGPGRRQGHLPDGAYQAAGGPAAVPGPWPGTGLGGAPGGERMQELAQERLAAPPGGPGRGALRER